MESGVFSLNLDSFLRVKVILFIFLWFSLLFRANFVRRKELSSFLHDKIIFIFKFFVGFLFIWLSLSELFQSLLGNLLTVPSSTTPVFRSLSSSVSLVNSTLNLAQKRICPIYEVPFNHSRSNLKKLKSITSVYTTQFTTVDLQTGDSYIYCPDKLFMYGPDILSKSKASSGKEDGNMIGLQVSTVYSCFY